jgi:hypothetical protein
VPSERHGSLGLWVPRFPRFLGPKFPSRRRRADRAVHEWWGALASSCLSRTGLWFASHSHSSHTRHYALERLHGCKNGAIPSTFDRGSDAASTAHPSFPRSEACSVVVDSLSRRTSAASPAKDAFRLEIGLSQSGFLWFCRLASRGKARNWPGCTCPRGSRTLD